MPANDEHANLISAYEAMRILQISSQALTRLVQTGILDGHKAHRTSPLRFHRQDVLDLVGEIEPSRKPRKADVDAIEHAPVITRTHLLSKFCGLSPRIKDALLLCWSGLSKREACKRSGVSHKHMIRVIKRYPRQVEAYRTLMEHYNAEADAQTAAIVTLLKTAPAD